MTTQKAPPRRRATQARSKATVQRILDAAVALLVEKGGEPVTMTEIAQRADVVIGSLYQYFSDRSAIHKAILIRHNAEVRIMLHTYFSGVTSFEGLIQSVQEAFDEYFDMHRRDPLVNSIWSIVQTDPELQKIDIEDSLQNARYICSIAQPMLPRIDPDKLMAGCVLLNHQALQTGRLARAIPPELGALTLPIFQRMMRDTLHALKAENDAQMTDE
ncbi:MAG: TetR/AcrR family transcriptional regulator [Caulobacteraceae bacterium]|nr:TetR/AcrR family transcriptional regulator [Caulobacteraceae bacterium]